MLTVISPAKKLDMDARDRVTPTLPSFQDDADNLASVARKLSVPQLRKLMGISEALAELNADRFRDFAPASTAENSKPALFAFAGDTYTGLEAASLEPEEITYAQDHLRILSGLYGLLRPLDAMQPYRLEMGSRLKTKRGKSLYDYWGDQIALALNAQADETGTGYLVNCASQEYFGAVDLAALKLQVITPSFLEDKPGGPKIVSFFAKKARGAMARFLIQNRITEPNQIKDFDIGGYVWQADLSTPEKPVFLRPDQMALKQAS